MGSTLHTAAANNHPLVIQAILLSVPKSQRLKLLKVRPFTPLHMAMIMSIIPRCRCINAYAVTGRNDSAVGRQGSVQEPGSPLGI